jgi:hypothetical protein
MMKKLPKTALASAFCSALFGCVKEQKPQEYFIIRPYAQQGSLNLNIKKDLAEISSTSDDAVASDIKSLQEFAPLPNTAISQGIGIVWKGISISAGAASTPVESPEIYGETKYSDFQIHSVGWHFGYDLYAQLYKGFYITEDKAIFEHEDADRRTPLFPGSRLQVATFPELEVNKMGLSAHWVFLPQYFSLPAAFSQTSVLDQRGLSPLIMTSLEYLEFKNIPESIKTRLNLDTDFDRWSKSYALSTVAGIGITVRYKDIHTSAESSYWKDNSYYTLVLLGGNTQLFPAGKEGDKTIESGDTEKIQEKVEVGKKFHLRFAYNFDVEVAFFGISAIYDATTFPTPGFQTSITSTDVQLFLGMRL